MKVKAALLNRIGGSWEVEEVDLGDPIAGEVQVRLAASGLCHSDAHVASGASPVPSLSVLGGHEGAGVITKVGPAVSGLAVGDHVVLAFIPACGTCPSCATGQQNLCDEGAGLLTGQAISDKSFRVSRGGQPVVQMCLLGVRSHSPARKRSAHHLGGPRSTLDPPCWYSQPKIPCLSVGQGSLTSNNRWDIYR
jgi:Zn-dependent alcohol dehydrogenase